jgi:hypothetical protein
MRWLFALAVVACGASSEPPPPTGVAAMPKEEIQRSRDACVDYVKRACECAKTVAAAKKTCDLAPASADAVRLGLEVAANPETADKDLVAVQANVRKAVAACIEGTASLAQLGCP